MGYAAETIENAVFRKDNHGHAGPRNQAGVFEAGFKRAPEGAGNRAGRMRARKFVTSADERLTW